MFPCACCVFFFSLADQVPGLETEDWLAPSSREGSAAAGSLLRKLMRVEAWEGLSSSWASKDQYRGPAGETSWFPCVTAAYPYTGTNVAVLRSDDSWEEVIPLLPDLGTLSHFSTLAGDPYLVEDKSCLLLSYEDGPVYCLPAVMHCMFVGWFWDRCKLSSLDATVFMQREMGEEWSIFVSTHSICRSMRGVFFLCLS